MSTPIQTQEELISVAYVSAIIALAGAVPSSTVHDFGVDLEVRRIGNFDGKRIDLGSSTHSQNIAHTIAFGHAFSDHAHEFGISDQAQF